MPDANLVLGHDDGDIVARDEASSQLGSGDRGWSDKPRPCSRAGGAIPSKIGTSLTVCRVRSTDEVASIQLIAVIHNGATSV